MATMQDFGGLLFGGGGTGLEDYLSAGQQDAIRNQAMLQAAAALLSAGGPSERPVSIGQALGGALQAGSQGYQQAQQGAIQNLLTGQKLQEAKRAMDLQRLTAQTLLGGEAPPEGAKPEDIKFNQYMKLADIYAGAGKGQEAKLYQDMAYQIKPRAEVTGSPFEVTDATTGKPILVQQMKDGSIRTVSDFGPKRDVVLQKMGGYTVAIDKSKLKGGETYTETLAPQVVGGAEGGYYVVGGGGGVGGAPSAGGGAPRGGAPAGQVVPPAAPVGAPPVAGAPIPIIAGTGVKPSESFYKSALGIQNTNDAINNFTTVLEGFKTSDMFSPEKRAILNSAHSNAMLQAKELYNLGVLTGGDEAILNKVLSNPIDFTNAATPIEAIRKQAEDLQKIVKGANENLARVYKQPEITLNKPLTPPPASTLQEGMTSTSKSGKPIIVRNGQWEYVK